MAMPDGLDDRIMDDKIPPNESDGPGDDEPADSTKSKFENSLKAYGSEAFDYEYQSVVTANGFQRWLGRCMSCAGYPGLNALDVVICHSVNRSAQKLRVRDIALLLNVDDVHTLAYSLRKLEKRGLVVGLRKGKEKLFETTEAGRRACDRYMKIRDECLTKGLVSAFDGVENLTRTIETLHRLAGAYDHASRIATAKYSGDEDRS